MCDRTDRPLFASYCHESRRERTCVDERIRNAGKAIVHDQEAQPCAIHQCLGEHVRAPSVCIVQRTLEHRHGFKLKGINDITLLEIGLVFLPQDVHEAGERICHTLEEIRNDLTDKMGHER